MRILFVNDDGIRSEGLRAIVHAFEGLGERVVYAPTEQKSAFSHSISLHRGITLEEVPDYAPGVCAHAVDGTPADCAKLAIAREERGFDLVVSGINSGSNLGIDTRYSGTVGGAMEGVFYGIPALAVSLDLRPLKRGVLPSFADYRPVALLARGIVQGYPPETWNRGLLLNLNAPWGVDQPELVVAPLGFSRFEAGETYRFHSGSYHLSTSPARRSEVPPESDGAYLRQGKATLTPLCWDSTDYASLGQLREIIGTPKQGEAELS